MLRVVLQVPSFLPPHSSRSQGTSRLVSSTGGRHARSSASFSAGSARIVNSSGSGPVIAPGEEIQHARDAATEVYSSFRLRREPLLTVLAGLDATFCSALLTRAERQGQADGEREIRGRFRGAFCSLSALTVL